MFKGPDQERIDMKYHWQRLFDMESEPVRDFPPMDDLEDVPIVTLENSVAPLVSSSPLIKKFARYIKEKLCPKPPPDGLTVDESSSIMLYSMGWLPLNECSYCGLNEALRSDNREKLKPWSLYLKLFFTALSRLPPYEGNVYRGVILDVHERYNVGQNFAWWGFSSCTNIMHLIQAGPFLNVKDDRVVFNVKCKTARDITKHCTYQSDEEIILLPGTQFKCQGCFYQGNNFRAYEVEEISIPSMLENFFAGKTTKPIPPTIESDGIEKSNVSIPNDALKINRWMQNGTTVAGGNGLGTGLNQLFLPISFCMDNDQTFYIADSCNNRIIEWKCDAKTGSVVAGRTESGHSTHQLDGPSDVILDSDGKNLIICDAGNRRIVQWPRTNGPNGKVLFSNFDWHRVVMDTNGSFYLSDSRKNEVTRWKINDTHGLCVAGKGEAGSQPNQLDNPTSIFLDANQSVYISDTNNHRIMKWPEGATEGSVVAGGNGSGNNLNQLASPRKVFVDKSENIYIADTDNHRIVCWPKGAEQGTLVVGENGEGNETNQLRYPKDFLFDHENNLYVLDSGNHRIQRFNLDNN